MARLNLCICRLWIIFVLALAGCSGGGGSGTTANCSECITQSLTATTVPELAAELSSEFPGTITQSQLSSLSQYSLTQQQAYPNYITSISALNGSFDQYFNFQGYCYVLNAKTYDQLCGQVTAIYVTPDVSLERVLLALSATAADQGTSSAIDLTDGLTQSGQFRVFTGFMQPVTSGGVTTVPFAIVIPGDVYSNGTYAYSDVEQYYGSLSVAADGNTPLIPCVNVSFGNNGAQDLPALFVRYTQNLLNPGSTGLPAGIVEDDDDILTPHAAGSVPAAASNCTSGGGGGSSSGSGTSGGGTTSNSTPISWPGNANGTTILDANGSGYQFQQSNGCMVQTSSKLVVGNVCLSPSGTSPTGYGTSGSTGCVNPSQNTNCSVSSFNVVQTNNPSGSGCINVLATGNAASVDNNPLSVTFLSGSLTIKPYTNPQSFAAYWNGIVPICGGSSPYEGTYQAIATSTTSTAGGFTCAGISGESLGSFTIDSGGLINDDSEQLTGIISQSGNNQFTEKNSAAFTNSNALDFTITSILTNASTKVILSGTFLVNGTSPCSGYSFKWSATQQ